MSLVGKKLPVSKTVKMYVGGAFIRSESGATKAFHNIDGSEFARVCIASRKDFRNAIVKAKPAAGSWASKTAYNRSQILYRMGEMAQGKFDELTSLFMQTLGWDEEQAADEVQAGIDTFIYYAGWCDKYQQVLGAVNPVAAPYHNFTTPEHMGVVVLIDSNEFSFQKLVDNICAILVGGNSIVVMVSEQCSPIVTTLGEIFATSDLPDGVVNLLSGDIKALSSHVATHMEVKAISFQNENEDLYFDMRSSSIDNMKRIIPFKGDKRKSIDLILDFVEQKTVWHPIDQNTNKGSAY